MFLDKIMALLRVFKEVTDSLTLLAEEIKEMRPINAAAFLIALVLALVLTLAMTGCLPQ